MSTNRLPADPNRDYMMSRRRVITRRGVLWLGQTCNLRCHFCYFLERIENKEHPEHPFMSLDKARAICSTLVDHYGNNAIDIQGGEPTIYKDIFALTEHCQNIGLLPTLITNAIPLSNERNVTRLKESGVRDLLISIQGIGETYDKIVGVPKSFDGQMKGLDNVLKHGIPIRFNCVLSKPALPQLAQISRLAIDSRARVVNFLAFNPFEDQQLNGKRSDHNVPRYSEVAAYLDPAIDDLEAAGVEVNVRYLPLCVLAERHRKNIYDFQQLSYDIHEWDYASWSWTGRQPQRMKALEPEPVVDLTTETYAPASYRGALGATATMVRDLVRRYPKLRPTAESAHKVISKTLAAANGTRVDKSSADALYRANGRMRASAHCRYVYAEACSSCAAREICDGFHGDYAAIFGAQEARPIEGEAMSDPRHYIRDQDKVVESEDYSWAL